MGNRLIVGVRKVLKRNPSSNSKTKSITYANDGKPKQLSDGTDGHEAAVDELGNFTRSASGSIKSSKALGKKVSVRKSGIFLFTCF